MLENPSVIITKKGSRGTYTGDFNQYSLPSIQIKPPLYSFFTRQILKSNDKVSLHLSAHLNG